MMCLAIMVLRVFLLEEKGLVESEDCMGKKVFDLFAEQKVAFIEFKQRMPIVAWTCR